MVVEAFVLGFALPVGARHFQTGRPKTAFVRLALMQDRGELFHAGTVGFSTPEFMPITATRARDWCKWASRRPWRWCTCRRQDRSETPHSVRAQGRASDRP